MLEDANAQLESMKHVAPTEARVEVRCKLVMYICEILREGDRHGVSGPPPLRDVEYANTRLGAVLVAVLDSDASNSSIPLP